MDCIKSLLGPYVSKISNSSNELAALSYQIYDLVIDYLEKIIDMKWSTKGSKLALLGGIIINCDDEGTDRFLPLKFEIRTTHGRKDLYEETFGIR